MLGESGVASEKPQSFLLRLNRQFVERVLVCERRHNRVAWLSLAGT